jgi:CBS domain-containing protein
MNSPVIVGAPSTSTRDLAGLLLTEGFSGVPITDDKGEVLGIVTEANLIRALRWRRPLETTTASDIMSTDVKSVDINTPITVVMEVLETEHFIRVPVTQNGKLVGVISRRDVIKANVSPKFQRYG